MVIVMNKLAIRMKKTFDERKYLYMISYLVLLIISLVMTGVPSLNYLIPFKLMPLLGAYLIGTAIYLATNGKNMFHIISKLIKPILYYLLFLFIFSFVINYFQLQMNDLRFLIGI